MLPGFQNAMRVQNVDSNAKEDLWSEQNQNVGMSRKTHVDFPNLNSVRSNQNNNPRESSIDSQESDNGYDTQLPM